jgi:hypothetical protein
MSSAYPNSQSSRELAALGEGISVSKEDEATGVTIATTGTGAAAGSFDTESGDINLGSTSDSDLVLKRNNVEAVRIESTKDVSILGSLSVTETVNYGAAFDSKTIASDSITATSSVHKVIPESGTADDLSTINGGVQGDRLTLMSNSATNTTTVKSGTGNIFLSGGEDKVLNNTVDKLELVNFTGNWHEVSYSSLATAPISAGSSPVGQVAVSDGSGGTVWKYYPEGWGYYKDDGAAQVFTTTPSKIQIDGAGSTSDSAFLPREIRGSGELWDTTADSITPITDGDSYSVRLDLPVTAESGNPKEITLVLDIGGTGSITIPIATRYEAVGRAVPYTLSIATNIFDRTTFLANGGDLFLSTDIGTVTVDNPAILITRTSAGDF